MAIAHGDKETKNIGSWQELFVPSTSDHVKKLRMMPSGRRKFAWNACGQR